MGNGIEIERKFLVKDTIWKPKNDGLCIRQGYLSVDKERTVRVRIKGEKGYLTVKGITRGISRVELEYEIPVSDAVQMLEGLCLRPLVEKTRYVEEYKGQLWEIDVFQGDNQGLVVAEAELFAEDQVLELPKWAGQEVTGDKRYYNSYLSRQPYKTWT